MLKSPPVLQKLNLKKGKLMTKKSVGAKIEQLNQNLEWFYDDDFKLEDAAKKYQEAAELAKDIEEELETLKNQIEVISKDFSIE